MVTVPLSDPVGGDLPIPLGGGQASVSGKLDAEFDVFVAGLAFNLHINKDQPYRRETAEWRKQQVDQQPEAGEQTLSDWWLRSQMTFHGGAGLKYLDTTQDEGTNRIRFADSRGVDVWTAGEIKPLPDTTLMVATTGRTWAYATTVGSESYLVYAYSNTVRARRKVANDTITYTVTGMTGTVKSMVIDGSHYYVATSDGHVFTGPIDNSAAGVAVWDFVSSSDVTLGWVKQRLMAGIDNKVYELAGTGPALPTALYTHPSAGWRWSAWSDAPTAILGAGADGLNSAIYAFPLDDSTGAPVLLPGQVFCQLPVGEIVNCLYLYLGSKLAIGTTAGLRVGQFAAFYGTFDLGPLSVTTLTNVGAVTAITGRGNFLYAGSQVEGETSLLRLDLSTQTADGPIYAWAPDLRTPSSTVTGQVNALTVDSDGRLAFAVQGYGVVREATTYGARESWLRTGRLRFGTVEPKNMKYGRVRTEGAGTVSVTAATDTGETRSVYTAATDTGTQRFALINGPAEWVQLTFTLTGASKLTSYQVMALPAQPRQRLFALPVAVFDREKNRHQRDIGYPGRAKELLGALEAIESSGDEVTVQCPVLGMDATRCTVERIEFTQLSNPVAGKAYGLGGYANLVFRTTT
jgi:hypothetical protein